MTFSLFDHPTIYVFERVDDNEAALSRGNYMGNVKWEM
jgi:hypothetical protein